MRSTVYAALAALPEGIERLLAIVRDETASHKDQIAAVATLAKIAGCPWRLPDVAANVIPDLVIEELDELARGHVDVRELRRKLLELIGQEEPVQSGALELPAGERR